MFLIFNVLECSDHNCQLLLIISYSITGINHMPHALIFIRDEPSKLSQNYWRCFFKALNKMQG